MSSEVVVQLVMGILSPFMHVKRARSVAFAVLGAMHARRWSINEIGRAMARVRGGSPKHAIKQVDRLLGNEGFDLEDAFKGSVPFIVGARKRIVVALDWTDFDADGQCTAAIRLITNHGRATPLVWKTVRKNELANRRNAIEDEVLMILRESIPADVKVTVLADRGFGSIDFYAFLAECLNWDFIVRFRGDVGVYDEKGSARRADSLLPEKCGTVDRPDALLTSKQYKARVVCTRQPRMKDTWCLATSLRSSPETIVKLYGKRFTIEESFRDDKDPRFGLGISETTIGTPERRDRLFFVTMLATVLMTLVGAAGEEIGLDRQIRVNTRKSKRSHSLFRQAREYLAGACRGAWGEIRVAFQSLLTRHSTCRATMGVL